MGFCVTALTSMRTRSYWLCSSACRCRWSAIFSLNLRGFAIVHLSSPNVRQIHPRNRHQYNKVSTRQKWLELRLIGRSGHAGASAT